MINTTKLVFFLLTVILSAAVIGSQKIHAAGAVHVLVCRDSDDAYLIVTQFSDGSCTLSFNPVIANALEQQGTDLYLEDRVTHRHESLNCRMEEENFLFSAERPKEYSTTLQGLAHGGMILYYTKYVSRFFISHYTFYDGECHIK